MRKRIGHVHRANASGQSFAGWLSMDRIATVEVTSEDPGFPVESAFTSNEGPGWRASHKGKQQIRVIFDEPVALRRIQLRFHEAEAERTQEFSLRWSSDRGGSGEIVRQRWNFSPAGSTVESEDYAVDLEGVSALELTIDPDVTGHEAIATLAAWRVA